MSGLPANPPSGVGNSPEEFAQFIRAEIARWGPVVKASGTKPD